MVVVVVVVVFVCRVGRWEVGRGGIFGLCLRMGSGGFPFWDNFNIWSSKQRFCQVAGLELRMISAVSTRI